MFPQRTQKSTTISAEGPLLTNADEIEPAGALHCQERLHVLVSVYNECGTGHDGGIDALVSTADTL